MMFQLKVRLTQLEQDWGTDTCNMEQDWGTDT